MTQVKRPTITFTVAGFAGVFTTLWVAYDAILNGPRPLHWKVLAVAFVIAIVAYPNGLRLKKWAE